MSMLEPIQPKNQVMRSKIIKEYETLARLHGAKGPFLEIMHGLPQNAISLGDFLGDQERHVIVSTESKDIDGVLFHKGNPNDMTDLFEDECFSTVIWDRALERDAQFWLTLQEIKRVLMPGGLLIVCARGLTQKNKFGIDVVSPKGKAVPFMTPTGALSAASPDYWRISPQAMRNAVLKQFEIKEVRALFMIPHIFGVGVKPL